MVEGRGQAVCRALLLLWAAVLAFVLATSSAGGTGGGGQAEGGHGDPPHVTHIKGSTAAPQNRLQYVVSIRRQGTREHVCTGVLVEASHVLTAAHCVDPDSAYSAGPRAIAHIGGITASQMDGDMEVIVAEKTIFHKRWPADKSQRSPFNVALMKLSRPSKYPSPTLLQDHFKLATGQQLIAAGWGAGSDGPALGGDVFGSLKVEPQEYMSGRRCNGEPLWGGSVDEAMVCGLNQERRSSCVVDSGSPLLLLDSPGYRLDSGTPSLDFVIGVNVDGAPCGTPAKPDVYVDLRSHADWLQANLKTPHIEL